MRLFSIIKNKMLNIIYLTLISTLSFNVYAARSYDIGTSSNAFLASIISGLQLVINAIGGPGILIVVILSFIACWSLWTFKPDSKATMFMARVLVGAIALFNLTLFMSWVQS